MASLRGGRPFRVTGASSQTGEEVEIVVDAYDEADALRAANRQGIFVSGCVAAEPNAGRAASGARIPARDEHPVGR
jgi:hypothetical protein